jgi:hypothetical protein
MLRPGESADSPAIPNCTPAPETARTPGVLAQLLQLVKARPRRLPPDYRMEWMNE